MSDTTNPMPHNCGLYMTTAGWCSICGPNPWQAAASKPCPTCAEKDAAYAVVVLDALTKQDTIGKLEARATAAERERDTWKAGKELADLTVRDLMARVTALAQREAEEAEKDKAFRYLLSMAQIHSDIMAGAIGRKAVQDARAALASPSTPSPDTLEGKK